MLINIGSKIKRRTFPIFGNKFMDYKNDNRTPRDRITGEFLSELLFTEAGGDCNNTPCPAVPRSRIAEKTMGSVNPCRKCQLPDGYNSGSSHIQHRKCSDSVEITGNYSLAMAYVKMQDFDNLFEPEDGFCEGTIFKTLRFPFYPTPCRKETDFR